jgi:hypothetical protein
MTPTKRVPERCSFCEKERSRVHCLIAGPPGLFICDECVELCNSIIVREELGPETARSVGWNRLGVDVTPNSLRVTRVLKGSLAADAGIEVGDILEHDAASVKKALSEGQPGGTITLKVRREGRVEEVEVRLREAEPKGRLKL